MELGDSSCFCSVFWRAIGVARCQSLLAPLIAGNWSTTAQILTTGLVYLCRTIYDILLASALDLTSVCGAMLSPFWIVLSDEFERPLCIYIYLMVFCFSYGYVLFLHGDDSSDNVT